MFPWQLGNLLVGVMLLLCDPPLCSELVLRRTGRGVQAGITCSTFRRQSWKATYARLWRSCRRCCRLPGTVRRKDESVRRRPLSFFRPRDSVASAVTHSIVRQATCPPRLSKSRPAQGPKDPRPQVRAGDRNTTRERLGSSVLENVWYKMCRRPPECGCREGRQQKIDV